MPMIARAIEVLVDTYDVTSMRDCLLPLHIASVFRSAGVPIDPVSGDIAYGSLTWNLVDEGAQVRFLWQAVEYEYDPHQKH